MTTRRAADRAGRGPLAARGRGPARRARAGAARLAPARLRPRGGELRRRQHVGQGHASRPRRPRDRGHVGQGLGQRPRDDGARRLHAAAARRDARRLRARRDERRGDGRPPGALPGRPGGAALVDRDAAARVRPGARHVHHTHPDGINVLAGTRDGERLVAECFGDEAAWIPYIRPGFTLAKQVGAAVRENPRLKLVVLAKHGLVVWGDTAEEAYRRTIEVINRAAEFVNARTAGSSASAARRGPSDGRASAARGPARAARRRLERARQGAGGGHVAARPRVRRPRARRPSSSTVGAACPDHLVHTKRVPLWIPFDPATRGRRDAAPRGSASAPRRSATTTAPTSSARRRPTEPADPDARVVLIQHVGLVGVGHDDQGGAAVARPLSPRDRGDGRRARARRLRLARRGRELRDRVLAARALQALAARRRPASCRARSRWSPARPAASAARSSTRSPRPARASRRSTSTATAPPTAVHELGDARGRGRRRRHVARPRWPRRSPPPSTPSAASTSSCPTPASPRARRSRRRTLAEWERNHAILGTGYFLVAREAFGVLRRQGRGGSIVFVASKNALVAGKNAAAYSSAKAAELHLARCLAEEGGAGRHPRQHRQPRRRPPGLARSGARAGARSAPPPTASSPTSSRSTTASAPRSA